MPDVTTGEVQIKSVLELIVTEPCEVPDFAHGGLCNISSLGEAG